MDQFIGKEVFVILSEEDVITEISFYKQIATAEEHLRLIDPIDEPDTKVFHGILARADSVPSDIKDKTCYIIASNMSYGESCIQGILYQSECDGDIDILAGDIEDAVSRPNYNTIFTSEIEDIYILYGYEVGTGLSINVGSLDEEIIHTCKTIATEADEIREKYLNN